MDNSKIVNTKTVIKIAKALKELLPQVVFVGGAIIGLYADDSASDEIRPTEDIDLTIQLSGVYAWTQLQERLSQLGFSPDPQGHSICSYLYQGISVDILPAEDSHLGLSNRWYQPGFDYINEISMVDVSIKILSAPYFLATKFEAFNGRGGDYRTSHDFEDIIFVIDNRMNIVEEVLESDNTVKSYIIEELIRIMSNPYSDEIIRSQLNYLTADERLKMVIDKIQKIITK